MNHVCLFISFLREGPNFFSLSCTCDMQKYGLSLWKIMSARTFLLGASISDRIKAKRQPNAVHTRGILPRQIYIFSMYTRITHAHDHVESVYSKCGQTLFISSRIWRKEDQHVLRWPKIRNSESTVNLVHSRMQINSINSVYTPSTEWNVIMFHDFHERLYGDARCRKYGRPSLSCLKSRNLC